MAFRKFDTMTWQDPWFEVLEPKEKLLFIYLWTNNTCNQSGVYPISKRRIEFEIGFAVDGILEKLAGKVEWIADKQIVWVKKFFRRQCQSGKFAIAALNNLDNMPDDIREEWIRYNIHTISSYDVDLEKYHIDTISIPYPLEAEADTEADTDTESVISIPLIHKNGSNPSEFNITQQDIDIWGKSYPRIDVLQTLREIREWNLSNPGKRKTVRGIRKHITGWLLREQDKSKDKAEKVTPDWL